MTPLQKIIEHLDHVKHQAEDALEGIDTPEKLEAFRVRYFGRTAGIVTEVFKRISEVPAQERPAFGKEANLLKQYLLERFDRKSAELRDRLDASSRTGAVDVTLPGRTVRHGHIHPITRALDEAVSIFTTMGFEIAEGPEIETDYYNFETLNMPADHPARDMQDTFYLHDGYLLRTHTSPVQVRTMERRQPPVSIIVPGRVFRRDWDITHTPMFHQIEGLFVDRGVSMAHLKGVLEAFLRAFFGMGTKVRFRPSYFPFTEPSAEVDIGCIFCKGEGCRLCKSTGWLEILGAGMVHPRVLERVKYDTAVYTGFAFGMGIERLAMLKYGIDDIRLFYESDLRFLRQ